MRISYTRIRQTATGRKTNRVQVYIGVALVGRIEKLADGKFRIMDVSDGDTVFTTRTAAAERLVKLHEMQWGPLS